ncbi:MutS-related protein [Clostridium muellerianum]|uniref:MutS-related protein n=1 Tax=Clostridium muellerianum TaxID=2716538 RepID=UPI00315A0C6C
MNIIGEKFYEKRKSHYLNLIKKQQKVISTMSTIRFIIFFAGILITSFLYTKKYVYLSISSFLVFLILFVFIVTLHRKVKKNKNYAVVISKINDNSAKRFNGKWKEFSDSGKEFIDDNHNYSSDLDIFGKGSLFQWINTSNTYFGREKLKASLSSCSKNIGKIRKRQEAIRELSKKLKWRQKFEAEGKVIHEKIKDPAPMIEIAKSRNPLYTNIGFILMFKILPLVTCSMIVLHFTTKNVSRSVPLALIALQIFLLIPKAGQRFRSLGVVYEFKNSIKIYDKMIKLIEKEKFNSTHLTKLKSNLINDKNTASKQIVKLVKLCDSISQRRNSMYIIINILFLWDYQCMFALEKWKNECGDDLGKWINTIGEFEELCSLSIINHDYPKWCIPKITEDELVFEAFKMAHPLLGDKGVNNNLIMRKPSTIGLITGSNMSGKSTLLRTSGINLVLAYSGSAVCAESFCCSMMEIYTCMRVSDNLEKNISSFYAELLKIKNIVKASKEKKEIFFLLDEIFKGTNSLDRHMGAKVLINSLSKEKTLGLVSTHDLELGDLQEESNNKIKNYHFREYYKNNQIYFDYKLQNGISKTRNALYLMKMAGIEIKNDMYN